MKKSMKMLILTAVLILIGLAVIVVIDDPVYIAFIFSDIVGFIGMV